MSLRDKVRCASCRHPRHKHSRDPTPGGCRAGRDAWKCTCDGFLEPPAYLGFSEERRVVADTIHAHDSVLIDVDEMGYLIGIEIIDPPGEPRLELPPHVDESTLREDDET